MFNRTAILFLVLFVAAGCVGESQPDDEADVEESMSDVGGPPPVSGDTVTTESGLQYIVVREGSGDTATPGQQVQVHYTGWLEDGTKFDSSVDGGEPFDFALGAGRVIQGWDEGVAGTQVGEMRRLIIPSELGYGQRGAGGVIPPNADLIFDVELIGIL
ncbi:MAG: FKBP-type peptidyl-prolyl cis-trans isomerase [Gemmatimonadetes bacterium]|uniref:Peptidyl-prolyl cis-trans isomerase n=1 Tax=Candidatus Kutchimonas denitrificans TaxID=3056748 RepID=A0AAE4Z909_9BACT|nr:FKBP-type peptidyl-prolyl cis-trans isomerase [Gemmatimonadota bacterium]NIR73691.1 FKBP-type peptidyl-prolyl cis-trans isomerase [Candidatus Kutchimonas denitrificans]NIS00741.1 FKBP-type peptidyl-prolyl cis-trans isomerase [Gemmatimonadota bacterium]NIT66328.1 FKBP-type peptidyl-prolyl cis-trans isomerase [Gemmatimonadota bacterium]NIU51546.1 FKBP-type peptidyl-prolyl cis-trans isomerase [Gemmatimonadota bacterium]